MQSRHIDYFIKTVSGGYFTMAFAEMLADKMKIETTNLPEAYETPSKYNLNAMQKWQYSYESKYPHAAFDEVKRAVIKKFRILELQNTSNVHVF